MAPLIPAWETIAPSWGVPLLVVIPLVGLVGMLLVRGREVLGGGIAVATSLAVLSAGIHLPVEGPGAEHPVGGWPRPYGITLVADRLGLMFVVLAGLLFTAASAYHLVRRASWRTERASAVYPLVFPLLLLAVVGICVTGDLFNFYVFFELLAVASYMLVALGKHEPVEAAWKYSAQSVIGSVSLLMGIALVYGRTGSLDLRQIAERLDEPALFAAPFFLLAFLLKAAVFPFHFWQPDAHAAATTEGSMLLAGVLIEIGLFGLLRLGPLLFGEALGLLLSTIGGVSIVFGAAAAWRQTDAKRMLGFSSVSQLGFVLLAIAWGTPEALTAGLFFLVAHSLAKALLFMATGYVADGPGSTKLAFLQGRGGGQPEVAAAYLVGVLSLAGLPLTGGFVAKVALLWQGVEKGSWLPVGIVVIGSLMTLGYGLRAFMLLFWSEPMTGRSSLHDHTDEPGDSARTDSSDFAEARQFSRDRPARDSLEGDQTGVQAGCRLARQAPLMALAALVMAIGLFPGPLWELCVGAARDAGRYALRGEAP